MKITGSASSKGTSSSRPAAAAPAASGMPLHVGVAAGHRRFGLFGHVLQQLT
jgi:hypothetical protein